MDKDRHKKPFRTTYMLLPLPVAAHVESQLAYCLLGTTDAGRLTLCYSPTNLWDSIPGLAVIFSLSGVRFQNPVSSRTESPSKLLAEGLLLAESP